MSENISQELWAADSPACRGLSSRYRILTKTRLADWNIAVRAEQCNVNVRENILTAQPVQPVLSAINELLVEISRQNVVFKFVHIPAIDVELACPPATTLQAYHQQTYTTTFFLLNHKVLSEF